MKKWMKQRGAPLLVATAILAGLILFLGIGPVGANGGCIDIEKLVSVDGGYNFEDADSCANAPTTNSDAEYKLIVTNCGAIELLDVTIKDEDLGIDVNIGTLLAGEKKMFTYEDEHFENLYQRGICPNGPEVQNIATVTAKSGAGENYTDDDPACVKCEELCSIGDYVWEDANGNGCQDDEEKGIEGVTVGLFNGCFGDGIAATKTDDTGFYKFENLICGKEYGIRFVNASEIYVQTDPDSCLDDTGSNDDTKDSDCGNGGRVCATAGTESSPGSGDFSGINPTIDCGYVCEGVIGDFVWLDSNGTPGCQDPDEPGIKGVTVNLFQVEGCVEPQGDPFKFTTTDEQGKYLFEGLCPGDYRVKFVDPDGRDNTIVNQSCENFPPGPPPGTTDSDCGGPGECVTLTPGNSIDETIDCGKLPPECALAVDKKCQVEPPATGPFECKDKIDALKMIWNGSGTLQSVDAIPGGSDSFPEVQITVENGDQVVTVTNYQPSSNDVIWNWRSDEDSGQSEFHLSCSDNEMNGPEDCGKPQGNGKSNEDDKYDNVWLLDGLATDKGFVFDCTPQPAIPSDNCEFEASPVPGCKTDPEVNDLRSITFRYTGADCSASDNNQGPIGDKWDCTGSPGDDPVNITVVKDAGKTSSNEASVSVGETFTLGNDFSSESIVKVGGQTLTIHTSCSQPLAAGDVFGSLVVVGINGLSPGANVTYFYEVTNVGKTDAEVTSVSDDQLGELLENTQELNPSGSFTLEKTAFISETTENTVTVQGNVADTIFECSGASDTVTVTVKEPTCEAAIVLDKLEDDTIKWKITNTSDIVATLETLTVNFPSEYGMIKEVKLDGGIFKKDDSSTCKDGVPPGGMVGASPCGWTNPDVSKRQLDPDETRTLEVKFTQKSKGEGWVGSAGTATFEEGCALGLIKPSACDIGKPTKLVFQYTGEGCVDGNDQASDKWSCSGDPGGAKPVQVVMTKDADKFTVTPNDETIDLNSTFDIRKTDGGEFPSEIKFDIRQGDDTLQSLKMHTSCSQPLSVGDQFGSVIVTAFFPKP